MSGDIVERGGCAWIVAVKILAAPHHEPSIVHEGVILLALEPLLLRLGCFSPLAFGAFFDAMELDGFLGLLDGARKVALRLRCFAVGFGFNGVGVEIRGVVVLVFVLHVFQRLLEVLIAVVVHVVARDEGLVVTRRSSVLFCRTPREQEQQRGRHSAG